jgi:hypothetical protein
MNRPTSTGAAASFDDEARARTAADEALRRRTVPRLRAWLLRSGRRTLTDLGDGGGGI